MFLNELIISLSLSLVICKLLRSVEQSVLVFQRGGGSFYTPIYGTFWNKRTVKRRKIQEFNLAQGAYILVGNSVIDAHMWQ